jgi:hypothetical protein
MFCSIKCRDKVYELHGDDNLACMLFFEDDQISTDRIILELQDAFGGHDQLLKFLKENDLNKMNKTIFDFDWREDVEKKRIICSLSLDTSRPPVITYSATPASSKLQQKHPEYQKVSKKVLQIMGMHAGKIMVKVFGDLDQEGLGVSMMFSYLRPSCMPNVDLTVINNKCYGFLTRSVKAGQELFVLKG